MLVQAWRDRPVEEVARDPRFIAHRCGFDRTMIEIMHSRRPKLETLTKVEVVQSTEGWLPGLLLRVNCGRTVPGRGHSADLRRTGG